MIDDLLGALKYRIRDIELSYGRDYGRAVRRDAFKDMETLIDDSKPTILDIGASSGPITKRFLNQFDSPEIETFEPAPDRFKKLENKFSSSMNVENNNVAVGDRNGIIEFDIENLNPKFQRNGENEDISVNMIKLDDYRDSEDTDIIKIDTHGNELKALRGASEHIKKSKLIYCRHINFTQKHNRGEIIYSDLSRFLRDHGYKMYNLYETRIPAKPPSDDSANRYITGQATWTNVIFYNSRHKLTYDGSLTKPI